MSDAHFDAIVVGSGITGGWAAKELTERGLKVLLLERGRNVEHQIDYRNESTPSWDLPFRGFGDPAEFKRDYAVQSKGMHFTEWSKDNFVNDRENPYQSEGSAPFQWRRGYQLGGRSLVWGRQCYRWGDLDWGANARDGHGVDWPVRYADMQPWYDHVERFVGVSGSCEGLEQLPDGIYQPPMQMNAVEQALKAHVESSFSTRKVIMGRSANMTQDKPEEGRARCQNRNICSRGCSLGGYFSTQSSTLPAARRTGRITVLTDSLVESLEYDAAGKKVSGVRVVNTRDRTRKTFSARLVFLCAGSVNSVSVLLRSACEAFPRGLTNDNDVLGRYFMDHALSMSITARIRGFEKHAYSGNRPCSVIVPRFVNATEERPELLRGYSYQGGATRRGWPEGIGKVGIGTEFKDGFQQFGDWTLLLGAFAECLPYANNRITLDERNRDPYGLPQTKIHFEYGANEHRLLADALVQAKAMLSGLDATILSQSAEPGPPGGAVHEMGGAPMGADPSRSILDKFSRAHSVGNVFVTDGAAMASSACQNPSLTYMALTARAAAHAAELWKEGII